MKENNGDTKIFHSTPVFNRSTLRSYLVIYKVHSQNYTTKFPLKIKLKTKTRNALCQFSTFCWVTFMAPWGACGLWKVCKEGCLCIFMGL